MLIAGIALIVVGYLLTFGPLASQLGTTDPPTSDAPTDDLTGADADNESDNAGDSDANGDMVTGTEGTDEPDEPDGTGTEDRGKAAVESIPGDDDVGRMGDNEMRKKCLLE